MTARRCACGCGRTVTGRKTKRYYDRACARPAERASRPLSSAIATALWVGEEFGPHGQQLLQEVQAITGPGTLPTTGSASPGKQSDAGVPWLPIILASSLGAAALLAASTLLLRRRLTRR